MWSYNAASPVCFLDVEGKSLSFYNNNNNKKKKKKSCPCSRITHLIPFSVVGLAYPVAIPPSTRNWKSLETARVEPVVPKAPIYQRTRDPVITLSGIFSHFMSGN